MRSGIYLIQNKKTGQMYIGLSKDIDKRFYNHYKCPNKNSYIDNALLKYGIQNFSLNVIEYIEYSNDNLFYPKAGAREKFWIRFFNTFENSFHYNLNEGGENIPIRYGNNNHACKWKEIDDKGGYLKIKQLRNNGYTKKEICDIFNVSQSTLSRYLSSYDIHLNDIGNKRIMGSGFSKINKAGGIKKIKALKNNGFSQQDICKHIGVGTNTLLRYLKNENTIWAEIGETASVRNAHYKINNFGGVTKIQQLKNNGFSKSKIAKIIGVSAPSISNYLKRKYNKTWKDL